MLRILGAFGLSGLIDHFSRQGKDILIAATLKHQELVSQLLSRGEKKSVAAESCTDATSVVQ